MIAQGRMLQFTMANLVVWSLLLFNFSVRLIDCTSYEMAEYSQKAVNSTHPKLEVLYQRKQIDFEWVHPGARRKAIRNKKYIPINTSISGIKLWKNQIFLTVPRWKEGVPVTLARIDRDHLPGSPNLVPFPNWPMQELGNCEKFQFVQQVEIDTSGKMWIIDSGKYIPIDGSPSKGKICPAKLLVADLTSYNFHPYFSPFEQSVDFALNYTFPENVANEKSYLDDLVLGQKNGFVYIVDFGPDPALIVFSLKEKKSWRIKDSSMGSNLAFPPISVDGTTFYIGPRGLNGIALSPVSTNRTLYYCPLSTRNIYSIPTSELHPNASISKYVTKVGERASISDGIMMDYRGMLYFGLNEDNALGVWDLKEENVSTNVLAKNNTELQWIDSMAIDDSGYLYMVSNRLQNIFVNKVDSKEINYRVLRVKIDAKSYLYPKDT